jgi:transcription termination/antitermination protein NusG
MAGNNERAWYVVQTYSGCENAAKTNLEIRVKSMNMEELIFNVLVPEETTYEKKKNGEMKEVIVKPFPGYVFIDMIVTDESWFMVRNTPMVTGFLGSSGKGAKPVPLQNDEINPILKNYGLLNVAPPKVAAGDKIKVISGTFIGQYVTVDSVDAPKQTVKVWIEVFGRKTQAELSFDEIEKI